MDPEISQRLQDPSQAIQALSDLDWAGNPGLAASLRNSLANSPATEFCLPGNVSYGLISHGMCGKMVCCNK